MNHRLIIGATLMLLMMSVAASAQKADFSGTWVMDRARSEGVPPGMEQTMTVKQSGDQLEIEMKITGGPQGSEEIKDQFTLDGKEADYKPTVMKGVEVVKSKRAPKWSADGKGLDILEDTTVDGPDGMVNIKVTRHWQLSDDGKSLTVDIAIDGPRGVRRQKRVYSRK
ncbi:MAG TPA: hypothetical protein VJS44_09710 [Pyrinomonadaceae bacterium]|nr:hypothetical protein [Pyrinomonadaceae bacterium]